MAQSRKYKVKKNHNIDEPKQMDQSAAKKIKRILRNHHKNSNYNPYQHSEIPSDNQSSTTGCSGSSSSSCSTMRNCIKVFAIVILIGLLLGLITTVTVSICAEAQRIGDRDPLSSWWYNYIAPVVRLVMEPISGGSYSRSSSWYGRRSDRSSGWNRQTRQDRYMRAATCKKSPYDIRIEQLNNDSRLSHPLYRDGLFNNPWPTWQAPTVGDALRFLVTEPDDSHIPAPKEELDRNLPIRRPTGLEWPPGGGQFRVTWIGHSTLLIQVDGYNILTDPIFSKRASPVQFMGPARFREPALTVGELPRIDIVVISHNHYDHLDANSVEALNNRFGTGLRWLVPRGLAEFMQSASVINFQELDWWHKDCYPPQGKVNNSNPNFDTNPTNTDLDGDLPDPIDDQPSDDIPTSNSPISLDDDDEPPRANKPNETRLKARVRGRGGRSDRLTMNISPSENEQQRQLQIYFTPAQHWSRRSVNDVYRSLWGSYTFVSSTNQHFFFAGDTAYCPVFKEIRRVFGPMNGAAIPIGAYKPRWFARAIHTDPKDAVKIHSELDSYKSMAIHWGTFSLASEYYMEPAQKLSQIMAEATHLEGRPFLAIDHGSSMTFCRSRKGC